MTAGGAYGYHVLAKNPDGTSVGSSVDKVTYNPSPWRCCTAIPYLSHSMEVSFAVTVLALKANPP